MICLLHVLLCQITINVPFNLLCILILFDAVMKMPEMTSRSCPSSQPEPSKSTHPYRTGEFLVPVCSGLLAEWRCGWTRQGGWRDLFLYRCSLCAPGCTVECFWGELWSETRNRHLKGMIDKEAETWKRFKFHNCTAFYELQLVASLSTEAPGFCWFVDITVLLLL